MPIKETMKTVGRLLANEINAAVGYQQTFTELLDNNDVERAIAMMEKRSTEAVENLSEYRPEQHKITLKQDRNIYDKQGNFLRTKELNRIAIPYQKFINEVALVFLYGRPVLWKNATKNPRSQERDQLQQQLDTLDEAAPEREAIQRQINEIDNETAKVDATYGNLITALKQARFDAHLREAKRCAGAEGCSALLFHTYQDDEGKATMLIKTLAKSKQDDIYTLFDQYDRLVAFGWGYNVKDAKGNSVRHYDVYTKDTIYRCEQAKHGNWTTTPEQNMIGKIPVIVFIQEVEWDGAESMIERLEKAYSENADNIDDFGSPAVVASGEITNAQDLPQQEEETKVFELRNGGDLKYLTMENIGEARSKEAQMLESQIMEKTFTPTITLEALRGLSNASGATLRTVMMLASIKADRRKDSHDGLLSRVSSLMKAIMGNVLDIAGKAGYDALTIEHEFQEPFGADIAQTFGDLMKQYGAGVISMRTVLEQSYLVPNAEKEMERLQQEADRKAEQQRKSMMQDVFAAAE